MDKYKKLIFLSVFLTFITVSYAQTDTLFLSLDEALNLAWKQSPARIEAAIDKHSGILSLATGIAGILPTPSAQANYSKSSTSLLPDYKTSTYNGSISLNQVVFDPAAFGNIIKGKLYNDYYRLQAKDKTANLTYSVKTSYYTLAKTYNLYDVTQTTLHRAEDNYNLAKEKFRLGQITNFELLRSETFKTQAAIDLLSADKNLKVSMEDLKGQLGINDNTIIKPTTTPVVPDLNINLDKLISDIFLNNPTLLSSKKYKSIARTGYFESIARLFPSISLFWQSSYTDSLMPRKIEDWKDNDVISTGISLSFPVFEIKSYLLNIGNTRNETKRANVQLRNAEILLHKNAINSIFSFREARERYQYASQNLELNRSLLQLAQEQYRLGAISQLDLFDTELNFETAQNTYISALYDAYTSYAQIEYLLGITNTK